MANLAHERKIYKGAKRWNAWRREHPATQPDLRRIDLSRRDLRGMDLHDVDLENAVLYEAKIGYQIPPELMTKKKLFGTQLVGLNRWGFLEPANLRGADLTNADLSYANLECVDMSDSFLDGAVLRGADLRGANLDRADLTGAFLSHADFRGATLKKALLVGANITNAKLQQSILDGTDMTGADLSAAELDSADLSRAILVDARLSDATISGARIYGISAWNVDLSDAKQENLIVTKRDEPDVTVDDLEIAQFIYLMLDNRKIRRIIDTITSKVVLILGAFKTERKEVLDTLRSELRQRGFAPVLFDFNQPSSKDLTDTVRVLAQMSRFVIIDLTEPRCSPYELKAVYDAAKVPIQSLIQKGHDPFRMFWDLRAADPNRVLEPFAYRDRSHLIESLNKSVISPSLASVKVLEEGRQRTEMQRIAWEAQHGTIRDDLEKA